MKPLTVLILVGLMLTATPAAADVLQGKVVGITDGDTLTVLDAQRHQHRIRLNGIDAPESSQPFGQVSKQNLSRLVFGQTVSVIWHKTDRYGRIVGTIMRGQTDVCLAPICRLAPPRHSRQ